MYEGDIDKQEKILKETTKKIEAERKNLVEAREKVLNNAEQVISSIEDMQDRAGKAIEALYSQMAKDREESAKKFFELVKDKRIFL